MKIRIANLSDIHFFGHRIEMSSLQMSLKAWCLNYEEKIADLLVFSGDLFDGAVSCSHHHGWVFCSWMIEVLDYCLLHRIVLRFLEGTPSHDMQQLVFFTPLLKHYQSLGLDVQYHQGIVFERIPALDSNFLFVEDRHLEETSVTMDKMCEVIRAQGTDKTDFIVMHGTYYHQIPIAKNVFYAEIVSKLVHGLVMSGHIHIHSHCEKVVTPSSFTRMSFGEEAPKGGLLIDYDTVTNEVNWIFKENPYAPLFNTYQLTSNTVKSVESALKFLPTNSYVRLVLDDKGLMEVVRHYREQFPKLKFKMVMGTDKSIIGHNTIADVLKNSDFKRDSIALMKEAKYRIDHYFKQTQPDSHEAAIDYLIKYLGDMKDQLGSEDDTQ